MPGGPPAEHLPSDQLGREARFAHVYDQGSAPSDATSDEAEGEAHGWLIARSVLLLFLEITKHDVLGLLLRLRTNRNVRQHAQQPYLC